MAATNALRRIPADLSAEAGCDFRCLSSSDQTSMLTPFTHARSAAPVSYFVSGVNGFGSSSRWPGFTRAPG